jgi:hypothetical protein
MKANEQLSKTVKGASPAARSKITRKTRPASRKTASAKRASTSASRRPSQSTFAGYSDSAARLIARGKAAFGNAYAWAGEASSALPKTTRDLGLPDQKSLKTMIDERPLIIGAVGLGIGVALGSMLPTVGLPSRGKSARGKSSRYH